VSRDPQGAGVTYKLDVAYPARSVIEDVRGRLEGAGWMPLERDFLNPTIRTSFSRGRVQFEDRTKQPNEVHQWAGQWRNAGGDIVSYELTFEATVARSGEIGAKGPLTVRAIRVPAGKVKTLQEQISR
jgi:hypothetical protein